MAVKQVVSAEKTFYQFLGYHFHTHILYPPGLFECSFSIVFLPFPSNRLKSHFPQLPCYFSLFLPLTPHFLSLPPPLLALLLVITLFHFTLFCSLTPSRLLGHTHSHRGICSGSLSPLFHTGDLLPAYLLWICMQQNFLLPPEDHRSGTSNWTSQLSTVNLSYTLPPHPLFLLLCQSQIKGTERSSFPSSFLPRPSPAPPPPPLIFLHNPWPKKSFSVCLQKHESLSRDRQVKVIYVYDCGCAPICVTSVQYLPFLETTGPPHRNRLQSSSSTYIWAKSHKIKQFSWCTLSVE